MVPYHLDQHPCYLQLAKLPFQQVIFKLDPPRLVYRHFRIIVILQFYWENFDENLHQDSFRYEMVKVWTSYLQTFNYYKLITKIILINC